MATIAKPMLDTYPGELYADADVLARCIDECQACAGTCVICADADLAEDDVAIFRKCIRLCLDCADVCIATGNVAARQTGYDADVTRAVLEACIRSCRSCGDECERHAAHHEHCRLCAEVCRRCEQACRALLAAIA
jgi:Domain of Unknown Function (DUF326)